MEIFKSSNPAFGEKTFQKTIVLDDAEVMTEKGTMNKFFLLTLLVVSSASFVWTSAAAGKDVTSWMLLGVFGGLIAAFVTIFKPNLAPYSAPVYALLEGLFVGGASVVYNNAFVQFAPGIIMQAVGLTFGTVIAMFFLYRFGVIKATQRFRSIMMTAIFGIVIFYLLTFVFQLFGVNMSYLHDGSPLAIGISLFIVAIAALSLILDFDMIEKGVAARAPKTMEWYGAFGLIVTIVWLYLSILRLLGNLSSRN